jgi:hypothetical protein
MGYEDSSRRSSIQGSTLSYLLRQLRYVLAAGSGFSAAKLFRALQGFGFPFALFILLIHIPH